MFPCDFPTVIFHVLLISGTYKRTSLKFRFHYDALSKRPSSVLLEDVIFHPPERHAAMRFNVQTSYTT
jgi:hypothetical protein